MAWISHRFVKCEHIPAVLAGQPADGSRAGDSVTPAPPHHHRHSVSVPTLAQIGPVAENGIGQRAGVPLCFVRSDKISICWQVQKNTEASLYLKVGGRWELARGSDPPRHRGGCLHKSEAIIKTTWADICETDELQSRSRPGARVEGDLG